MVENFEWKWSIPQCRRVVCEIKGVTAWPKDIRLPKPEKEVTKNRKVSILKGNQVYRRPRKSDHATGEQGISTTSTPQTRFCVSSAPFDHPPNISDFHKSIMYIFNVGESKCTLYGSLKLLRKPRSWP